MIGVQENTLWVESFRPDTLEGYIGNEHIIEKVKVFIANGDVPHLLFYGTAGTGKTTLAKALAEKLQGTYVPEYARMYLNAHGLSYQQEDLLAIAKRNNSVIVYASSAATYGSEASPQTIGSEKPENPYGYSKYLMDQIANRFSKENPDMTIVGLRYFNAYGYNFFTNI